MPRLSVCLVCLVVLAVCGCDRPSTVLPRVVSMQPVTEIPGANLPADLRPTNWTDARGSGSCVIASNVYNLKWVARPEDADAWRRTYAGGQTDSSIRQKCDANGLQYYYTTKADVGLLQWVSDTRRSALIWFYDRHCVNFVGFHRDPSTPADSTVYAWLCDNNRNQRFIRIPLDRFAAKWAGYGGFSLSLADPPVPPPLFNALRSS